MKLLFDFLPILLFFIAYKLADIYVATAVAMAASVIQVAYSWITQRRVEPINIATMALILVLGGVTLLLKDEAFIKWKPTVVNWMLAAAFLGSQYIGKKPLLNRMLGNHIVLPGAIWRRLNLSWVMFFTFSGLANIYVMYNFDTDTWVNFKLFGMLGLTVVFVILQSLYMSRHIQPDPEPPKEF